MKQHILLILAAGEGKRALYNPKHLTDICGKTVLQRIIESYSKNIKIVIVTKEKYKEATEEDIKRYNNIMKNDVYIIEQKMKGTFGASKSARDFLLKHIPDAIQFHIALGDTISVPLDMNRDYEEDTIYVLAYTEKKVSDNIKNTVFRINNINADYIKFDIFRNNIIISKDGIENIFTLAGKYVIPSCFFDDYNMLNEHNEYDLYDYIKKWILCNNKICFITTKNRFFDIGSATGFYNAIYSTHIFDNWQADEK